ncbi:MAG: hypothetical protein CMJ46_13510 [Planctomyces sp.]|nr:hypothetical protein [Planctomyces sp.]
MNAEVLVDSYLRWLRENIQVCDRDGVSEVTTPFLDRHNDHLQIYVQAQGDEYRLSDDCYIISDLALSGCKIDTKLRRKLRDEVLNGFGVSEENDELFVVSDKNRLAQSQHSLIQAMLAINDMFMTSNQRVASFFTEDVSSFLKEAGVRFVRDPQFTGKSGFNHKFDFTIPASSDRPERLVRAINSPKKDNVEVVLFAWEDTRSKRAPDTEFYVFLNDSLKKIRPDHISAFEKYGIRTIRWSERQKRVRELSA